jgi:hypothetical protein
MCFLCTAVACVPGTKWYHELRLPAVLLWGLLTLPCCAASTAWGLLTMQGRHALKFMFCCAALGGTFRVGGMAEVGAFQMLSCMLVRLMVDVHGTEWLAEFMMNCRRRRHLAF